MSSRLQRLSLRARLLVVGLLGLAVALAVGSAVLYGVLGYVGYRSLDQDGIATGHDVAQLVDQDRLPDPIPVTGSQIVQVVDGRDRVVSASVNSDRLTAILRPSELRRAAAGSPVDVSGSRVGLDSPLRVVVVRAGDARRPRTVVVAQQFDDLVHSQHVLAVSLLVSSPLLLVVLALIAWRVMAAVLSPVEALRSTAERISGSEEDERLPVPTSDDEVRALALTLNSMLDRLASSRSRQRAFVADAAHELRSPLASMLTQLDVAEHLGEGSPLTTDLRVEVQRMTSLVESLLVLARLDADTARTADLADVEFDDVLAELRNRPSREGVLVCFDGADGVMVRAEPDGVRRALANLLDNAVRHARSQVQVCVEPGERDVVVAVEDDGAGIAEVDRERVFERFTRLDDARDRDAGGSGLGLAIVRELARRGGGDVRLGDAPSGGLRAELRLPRPPR